MPCPRFVCAVNPEKKAGKLAICNNTITLQNPYDVDVCFKIKTTAPKRYQVKPNAKRIAAHSSLSITGAAPLAPATHSASGRHKRPKKHCLRHRGRRHLLAKLPCAVLLGMFCAGQRLKIV